MSRIVKLNVGGTRYDTSISTIMQYPDSMLGAMIQKPREQEMIENGEELFIDRDGELFKYILRYLRDGDLSEMPDGDLTTLKQLLLESQFFMLDGLKAMIEKKLRVLTKDGWKVGDIVTDGDISANSVVRYHSGLAGTIVQFRTDGRVAVQYDYMSKGGGTMRLVNLKPKQA